MPGVKNGKSRKPQVEYDIEQQSLVLPFQFVFALRKKIWLCLDLANFNWWILGSGQYMEYILCHVRFEFSWFSIKFQKSKVEWRYQIQYMQSTLNSS